MIHYTFNELSDILDNTKDIPGVRVVEWYLCCTNNLPLDEFAILWRSLNVVRRVVTEAGLGYFLSRAYSLILSNSRSNCIIFSDCTRLAYSPILLSIIAAMSAISFDARFSERVSIHAKKPPNVVISVIAEPIISLRLT